MSKKNRIIIIVFILLSLFWCFAPWLIAHCVAVETNQEVITILRQQWIELKIRLKQQQVTLLTLQEEITMMKKPSRELMKNLNEAKRQLKTAQNELTASMEIEKLSILCSELKQQIQQEKKKASLKAKQNAFWSFVTGLLIGCIYNNS